MSKYQYIPTNASQPLPGRDFELQTVEFLDDAASCARWDKMEGRPGLASTEKDGLIPAEAMQKLEEIEATAEKLDALADVDAAPPPLGCVLPPVTSDQMRAGRRRRACSHRPLFA